MGLIGQFVHNPTGSIPIGQSWEEGVWSFKCLEEDVIYESFLLFTRSSLLLLLPVALTWILMLRLRLLRKLEWRTSLTLVWLLLQEEWSSKWAAHTRHSTYSYAMLLIAEDKFVLLVISMMFCALRLAHWTQWMTSPSSWSRDQYHSLMVSYP